MTQSQPSAGSPRNTVDKKVAVVTVHGVSDQHPYDSAQSIANLLLENVSEYSHFREEKLRLTVQPVHLETQIPQPQKNAMETWWDERGIYLRDALDQPTAFTGSSNVPDTSHQYMLDQVCQFHQESIYDSICLHGVRHQASNSAAQSSIAVDIYEMYWADLSRLGSGFVRIFGEFYQLLFHLISLGRQGIDYASLEQQNHRFFWKRYGDVQAIAGRILAFVVPIFNLYVLMVALLSIPGNLPAQLVPLLIMGIGIVALLSFTGWCCLQFNLTRFRGWLTIPFLVGLLGCLGIKIGLSQFTTLLSSYGGYLILAIIWEGLLALVMTIVLILPYNRHRRGVAGFAAIAGIGVIGLALFWLLRTPPTLSPHEQLTWASFRIIEGLYAILFASWTLFIVLYLVSVMMGACMTLLLWLKQGGNWRAIAVNRVVRAAWTARLTLALPALLFALLTLSLWSALAHVSQSLLPQTSFYHPWLLFTQEKKIYQPEAFAHQLTVFSGSSLMILIMLAIALVVGVVLWALLPSAIAEVQPDTRLDPKHIYSSSLGHWLSHGFWLMVYTIDGMICFAIPIFILFSILDGISYLLTSKPIFFTGNPQFTEFLLNGIAGVLTASATGLIAFGSRLNQITIGFRGILDAALDVDNYLRLSPADDNPTARICARYVSLLRYLAQWRDPQIPHQQYDAVVIIAHSQGTVISADLLRFLQREFDPALERFIEEVPIYLFTMGSPLRQLYNFAFPHFYSWVEQGELPIINPDTSPNSRDSQYKFIARDPHSTLHPSPGQLLGVREWVNAYRSGDYIGRALWMTNTNSKLWQTLPMGFEYSTNEWITPPKGEKFPREVTRKEFCLGAGAHTHYWDKYAPKIADELDRLIVKSVY